MPEDFPQPVRKHDRFLYRRAIALDRLLRGKEAWNEWAHKLVEKRLDLLARGEWDEDNCNNYDWIDCYEGSTYQLMDQTEVYFRNLTLEAISIPTYCSLPSDHPSSRIFEEFVRAYETYQLKFEWEGGSPFRFPDHFFPVHVFVPSLDFRGFIFPGNTSFTNCKFIGDVDFTGSVFWLEMEFDDVTIMGSLNMSSCDFIWQFYTRNLDIRGDFRLDRCRTFEAVDSFATISGDFSARGALFNECYCCLESVDICLGYEIAGSLDLSHASFLGRGVLLPYHVGGHTLLEHAVFTCPAYARHPDLYTRSAGAQAVFCRGISSNQ